MRVNRAGIWDSGVALRTALVAPGSKSAWFVLLILVLGGPVWSAPANPSHSNTARDVLEEGRQLGKLGATSFEQLLEKFSAGSRVRIMVRLETTAEPFAKLSGPQARNPASQEARREAIARIQTHLISRPAMRALRDVRRFRHVPYLALEVDADELRELIRQSDVASISSDEPMRLSLNDTAPQLGADLAWLEGYTGNGQVIAILDSGVDSAHQAFTGRIVDEACYSTTSIIENSTTLCPNGQDSQLGPGSAINCEGIPGCDHGTHVAGIAAGDDATYRGIAPDAGILPIQVFSQLDGLFDCGFAPPCLSAFTSDVVRGLERVYELRDTYPIAVVNMSLGGEAYTTAAECDAAYPSVKAAVDNLRSVGITTVVASGNQGQVDAIGTPACVSGAVSVGAVDVIDNVAWFSNSADFLDTLSGGAGIVAPVPGNTFAAKDGTSMAAPGVSGAVAVLRSADPPASSDEIVDVITTTGVPVTDWRNGLVTPRVQVDAAADLLTAGDLGRVALGLTPELGGLDEPIGVTHAGDGSGRLFIMQRSGVVLVRHATGLLADPFLDVSANVNCCAAEGLLGLAFHPDYESNGLVYASYVTEAGEIVVERYTASSDPDRVDPASAVEVIRIASTLDGHLGGRLQFGSDGYLYIATGDGAVDGTVAVPGAAGDPTSLLGKILRIDVDASGVAYALPPDNPLLGTAGARGEIWAMGLRDPRRFSFDSLSGELYIADVGESDAHEVNVQAAASPGGEHYGWTTMEGSSCRAGLPCDSTGLTLPTAEYSFAEGCAVTGGVVYRGPSHTDLYGAYLFGDLCSGRIWGLRFQDDAWQLVQMAHPAVEVSAFGSDESGETYLVDRSAGLVYRLTVSDLAISTVRLPAALVDLPYAETLAATGGVAPYQWAIIDGALPVGINLDPLTGTLSGTAVSVGSTVFTVAVSDAEFTTVTRTLRLTSAIAPLAIDTVSLPDASTDSGYNATLEASGGTPPYAWSASGGALPAGITLSTDGTLSGTATEQGMFTFDATVTDAGGEQATKSLQLPVYGTTLSLQLNVMDPGAYGHVYGSNQHVLGLDATFIGTGTDLTLQVTGFDIDYADELLVILNGSPLGYLSVGPNNLHNGGDSFSIPAGAQVPGVNTLRFQQKTAGWIWGVTNLLLTDIPPPLVVTTMALADATVVQTYSEALQATGGRPPYAWSLSSGALPAGIALNADGTLTGTPTEQGTFDLTARVTDTLGTTTDQPLSLRCVGVSGTIELVLEINVPDTGAYGNGYGSNEHPDELYAMFIGTATDLTLQLTGFDIDEPDELLVSLNGNPLGYLSVGPNNALNGGDSFSIPAGAQLAGPNLLRFQVKTAGWIWGVTDLLLSDAEPLAITTTTLADASTAQPYAASLQATGGTTPYSWALATGALPAGLALNADGTLTGTPTEQGTFNFTARVTDSVGRTTEQPLTVRSVGASGTIELVLEINVPDSGAYGNGYGSDEHYAELFATFTGTGTDLTLNVTGFDIDFVDELLVSLNGNPLGYLSVGPNNAVNGGDTFTIPAAAQLSGTNLLRFQVKTAGWIWGVTDLLLSSVAPLQITTTTLADATFGEAYSATLQATGATAPYDWTVTAGTLPAGLVLTADGTLTGTPTEQGTFNFTATVTDGAQRTTEQALTLRSVSVNGTVEPVLQINIPDSGAYGNGFGSDEHPDELLATFTGTGTDLTLQVTGFDIDFADELLVSLNGNPLGYLSVGPNNALNGGDSFAIPAGAQLSGTNLLRFQVKTAGWIWGVTDLLITDVQPALTITTTTLTDATFTEPYSATLEATGGTAPYAWTLSVGTPPAGIALNADGTLTGTPTQQGDFNFTARVTDGAGATFDQPLTLRCVGTSGTIERVLEINVPDTGAYGNGYGTNEHYAELYATFIGTGTDLTLQVTGFDIDYADELLVSLNGNPLGYLSVGPDGALNGGDSFTILAGAQLLGTNLLRFQVKTPGWIWGVTDLLVTDGPLALTIATTSLTDTTFAQPYSETLQAVGGSAPYSWSLSAGALPAGLSLNSDGSVTGTPTQQGDFNFTARVTDGAGATFDQPLTLRSIGTSGTIERVLEINVPDTGEYGNGYGSDEHYAELYATFIGTGTDLTLQVTGFDIDFADELLVTLNGNPLGYLSVGPNNALNGGDSFTIMAGEQLPGANLIRFQVKTPSWIWGVTDMLLAP